MAYQSRASRLQNDFITSLRKENDRKRQEIIDLKKMILELQEENMRLRMTQRNNENFQFSCVKKSS